VLKSPERTHAAPSICVSLAVPRAHKAGTAVRPPSIQPELVSFRKGRRTSLREKAAKKKQWNKELHSEMNGWLSLRTIRWLAKLTLHPRCHSESDSDSPHSVTVSFSAFAGHLIRIQRTTRTHHEEDSGRESKCETRSEWCFSNWCFLFWF
jgi:hypothetical protein